MKCKQLMLTAIDCWKIFIRVIVFAFILITYGCVSSNAKISREVVDSINIDDILFKTETGELNSFDASAKATNLSVFYPSRMIFNKSEGMLVITSMEVVKKIYLLTENGTENIGVNFDECGVASFLPKDNSIVFVTYDSFIKDNTTFNGPLVIAQYNIESGLSKLVELSADIDNGEYFGSCILGASSGFENYLYYKDRSSHSKEAIFRYDILTGERVMVFEWDRLILAPSISPSGEKIGFASSDGIYLYDIQTNDIQQIIHNEWLVESKIDLNYAIDISKYVPVISWSPDSDAIVYSLVEFAQQNEVYRIYVYNMNDTQAQIIINDGYFPYWVTD